MKRQKSATYAKRILKINKPMIKIIVKPRTIVIILINTKLLGIASVI